MTRGHDEGTSIERRALTGIELLLLALAVLGVLVLWVVLHGLLSAPVRAAYAPMYCAKAPWLAGPEFMPCSVVYRGVEMPV